jgi:hypothetical protein
MAINRVRIDYTVYPPDHKPGQPFWSFKTFHRAKSAARAFGVGARIYREFNQSNKRGEMLGDWWSSKFYWIWNGAQFKRHLDAQRVAGTDGSS